MVFTDNQQLSTYLNSLRKKREQTKKNDTGATKLYWETAGRNGVVLCGRMRIRQH
jgi:hypothetical protein